MPNIELLRQVLNIAKDVLVTLRVFQKSVVNY